MPTFVYDVIDSSGNNVKGKMEADSEGAVLSRLHEQRLHILSISEQKASAFSSVGSKKAMGAPKLQSLVVFSRQFATMVDAGLAVLKCLDILEQQTKDLPLKQSLNAIKRDVQTGVSLGDAMAKHTNCFSKLYINMIRAAELGGILDTILDRLAQFLEKEQEIRQKVKSALTYPIIVLCFAMIILAAMFLFILPTFKQMFADMGAQMPAMTEALFNMSDFMVHNWYLFVFAPLFAAIAIKQYGKTPDGAYKIDQVKLKIPIMGEIVLKLSVARFCRTFGTLLSSGVPMMRAIEIVAETAGNEVLCRAINDTKIALREGSRLSPPLVKSGLFPPMVTHMIDIGEETGRMSEMLVKVAEFYEQEVDATVKALTSLIEPILIVFLGVIVGFIVISIMGPMFSIINQIR
ncbi:type II secretion system F family protein [Armatimonas rosea]|uniref:Type IV pilus assembly protein PilC n=1 Tax=Armatimonas rosea TaxID=685828 RepID=A0A7W9W6D5_ARMRO|nr:type II secretion system F family protein [Armatimonas rosea]MBB6049457.1 type IV pilus assembly protein PilC [Armatimonas rosea]